MKWMCVIIAMLCYDYVDAQDALYIREKSYEGYIFNKEHCIWGFQPEPTRYTPTLDNIAQAEMILRDSIESNYVKSKQKVYRKPPINKKTLKKYVRQYIGFLSEDGDVIIQIYFNRGHVINEMSKDIIVVLDGGFNHWSIKINLSTKELFDMYVNGAA